MLQIKTGNAKQKLIYHNILMNMYQFSNHVWSRKGIEGEVKTSTGKFKLKLTFLIKIIKLTNLHHGHFLENLNIPCTPLLQKTNKQLSESTHSKYMYIVFQARILKDTNEHFYKCSFIFNS